MTSTAVKVDPAHHAWHRSRPAATAISATMPVPRERVFRGTAGDELGYVEYRPESARNNVALVYLHGIESHSGWFDYPARLLGQSGYDVYCLDRRGSGINRENRGFVSGHVDSFPQLFADIAAFTVQLEPQPAALFVVGLSWGGKLAMGFALERPRRCQGLVLITPGIKSHADISLKTKFDIAVSLVRRPTRAYSFPIRPTMFTTNPVYLQYIREDPLRLHGATARFFFESRRLDRFIARNISRNHVPIQLLLAGNDRIVNNDAVIKMLRHSKSKDLEIIEYALHSHSLQFETPERLVVSITDWLGRHTPAAC